MSSRATAKFKDLLYGVPVAAIAEWCCVSTAVAMKYKDGTRSPSRAAQKLFALHLQGRVVPEEWKGFCFRGALLWDPYGKPFTHGQLRAYELGLQLLRSFAYGDADRIRRVDALLSGHQGKSVARLPTRRPEADLIEENIGKPGKIQRRGRIKPAY